MTSVSKFYPPESWEGNFLFPKYITETIVPSGTLCQSFFFFFPLSKDISVFYKIELRI